MKLSSVITGWRNTIQSKLDAEDEHTVARLDSPQLVISDKNGKII